MLRKRFFLLVLALSTLLILAACGGTTSGEEQDAATEETNEASDSNAEEAVEEEENDHRVVATTVAIAEMLDALNIDAVGIPTSYKDLPKRFDDSTEVGNPMGPDLEIILSLAPTHVYTVTTLQADLEKPFADHNVPVDFLDLESVEGMFSELEMLGEEFNRTEEAAAIIEQFDAKMLEVAELVEGRESPKVLILMGIPGSYIVGTEHSYIGDLVKRAGGTNAVTGRDEEYISANTEYLHELDADIILRAAHGAPEQVVEMFNEEFQQNDIWKHFKAVQNERVYDLEETLFGTTANLAVEEAIDELLPLLYPNE